MVDLAPDMINPLREAPVEVYGFYDMQDGETPGTYWRWAGGFITADHVIEQLAGRSPMLLDDSPVVRGEGVIDAALMGVDFDQVVRPRAPVEGEALTVYGHPAGARYQERRVGRCYLKRGKSAGPEYHMPTWIGVVDKLPTPLRSDALEAADYWPIDRGMSGGLVCAVDGPIGLLVAKNNPTQLYGDPRPETSFEFVSLRDIYDVFKVAGKV